MPEDEPADERTGLAAEGVLTTLYGDHPRTKIIVALLSEDWHDLPVSKIADLADIHRSTVYDHLEPLLELGVILEGQEVGDTQCYRINRESELAKLTKRTEEAILDKQVEDDGSEFETPDELDLEEAVRDVDAFADRSDGFLRR